MCPVSQNHQKCFIICDSSGDFVWDLASQPSPVRTHAFENTAALTQHLGPMPITTVEVTNVASTILSDVYKCARLT